MATSPTSTAPLRLDSVGVSYHQVPACRDVTLEVSRGECVAVVGANGAGKSSLVSGVAGLEPLVSGRVLLHGKNIARLRTHARARHGLVLVPEKGHLFPEMTVEETLQVATRRGRNATGGWTVDHVRTLFPRLEDRSSSMVGNLSGGERQMLTIARALLLNPEVLMLDELSAGLAPAVIEEVLTALQSLLGQSIAMLLVEQSVHVARTLADRVILMQDGDVVQEGGTEVLANEDDVRRAYLGSS